MKAFEKPLSAKEEKEMIERFHNGDMEARNILVERNMRLVAHMVKKYLQADRDTDDLISVGTIGLIKAINNFNTELDVKFSTYAVPMIIGEIRRYMRDNSSIRTADDAPHGKAQIQRSVDV